MALTSQDLKKGLDITAQTTVTGSEFNQLIDAGRLGDDKGMNIVTQDTSLNVPLVPDPNSTVEGVLVTFWKRYTWVRQPFDNTGVVLKYSWNEFLTSDPTYLKWAPDLGSLDSLTARVDTLENDVIIINGQITAANNQILINTNTINNNTTDINDNAAAIASLTTAMAQLRALICPPGSLRFTGNSVVPTGWLKCDGTSYLRSDYDDLFLAIGTTFGSVDGTHFNVPDAESRYLRNIGNGSGLSGVTMGQKAGVETVTLTAAQSGLPAHSHTTAAGSLADNFAGGPNNGLISNPVTPTFNTDAVASAPAVSSHDNLSPFIGVLLLIKT